MDKTIQEQYDDWYNRQSDAFAEIIGAETQQAMAEYFSAAVSKGLVGAELGDYILEAILAEVGQRYDDAANRLFGGYAYAREVSADEFNDIVSSKIRTEILDKNICENCREEDQHEYFKDATDGEYYDEAGEQAPDLTEPQADDEDPIHCIGTGYGNPCRGIYLYTVGNDNNTNDEQE